MTEAVGEFNFSPDLNFLFTGPLDGRGVDPPPWTDHHQIALLNKARGVPVRFDGHWMFLHPFFKIVRKIDLRAIVGDFRNTLELCHEFYDSRAASSRPQDGHSFPF